MSYYENISDHPSPFIAPRLETEKLVREKIDLIAKVTEDYLRAYLQRGLKDGMDIAFFQYIVPKAETERAELQQQYKHGIMVNRLAIFIPPYSDPPRLPDGVPLGTTWSVCRIYDLSKAQIALINGEA